MLITRPFTDAELAERLYLVRDAIHNSTKLPDAAAGMCAEAARRLLERATPAPGAPADIRRSALEEAAAECDRLTYALDNAGERYYRPATADRCARTIRALASAASGAPGQEAEEDRKIVETYDKLHEGKLGAHWLWCVIEQIAAGVPEAEAFKSFGYYEAGPSRKRFDAARAAAVQAVGATPEQIEALAHRMAWRYRKSSDPHHSDTYTFNRTTLLAFAAALPPSGAGEKTS